MRLQVKAVHDHLTDSVKEYVEKRIGKLDRRLYEGTLVEVTLGKENNPSIADDHWAEAIVYMKGPNLVAKEHAATYEAAVDRLVDKLERQLDRYKDKRIEKPRRDARQRAEPPPVPVEEIEQELAADRGRGRRVGGATPDAGPVAADGRRASLSATCGTSRSRRASSPLKSITSFIGVLATTVAVRTPPKNTAISPNTSPGPSVRMCSPFLNTSASPP